MGTNWSPSHLFVDVNEIVGIDPAEDEQFKMSFFWEW
jgi:hypothetical protein